MKNSEAKKLFEKHMKEKVKNIKDCSKGYDQSVKIIETKDKKYVMKIPKKVILNFREELACKKLKGRVPVPRVILKCKNFLIENYIEGKDLDEVKLTKKQEEKIYLEAGKFLKEINKIKMRGFGFIGFDGKGQDKYLREVPYDNLEENMIYLKDKKLLSEKDISHVRDFLNKNKFYLDSKEKVLLHFDYEGFNIKVKDGKIVGVLDFGDLSSGPKSLDLARLFIAHYKTKKWEYFLKGYGNVNIKEVKFFSVLTLIWMIHFAHYIKDKRGTKNKIKILKELTKP